MTATETYAEYAESIAKGTLVVPRSVCIGSWRCEMVPMRKGDWSRGIRLVPVYKITGHPSDTMKAKRTTGLCIAPLRVRSIPTQTSDFNPSVAELTLANVLGPISLRVLMWVVGNSLVDPIDKPRAVWLYGSGGEGKSSTVNTILANLPGMVHPLSRDYPGSDHQMGDGEMGRAMSARFISYGDCVLTKSKVNATFWKIITGGDTIRVSSGQGRLNCSAIFASNTLWYPNSGLLKRWFVRRTIVLALESPPEGSTPPPESFTDVEISRFVMNCIMCRLAYDNPPLTIGMVLTTIFGYRAGVATRGVKFGDHSTDVGSLAATESVSLSGQIDRDRLVDLVECTAPHLVGLCHGVRCLIGLEPVIPVGYAP